MSTEYKAGAFFRPEASYEPYYRVSWSGIFAGAIIALVIDLALGFLGLGIGLGAGVGGGMWMVLSSIIALFIGGWVSSWVTEYTVPVKGALQGVFTWCLVTVIAFYLMTSSVGVFISGMTGVTSISTSTALWGFIVMVLSVVAAGLGGMVGISKQVPIARYEEKETRRAA